MWDLWEALQNTQSHPTHRAFIHQCVPHWLIWEHYSDSRLALERPGADRHRSRHAWEQRQGTTACAIGIFLCICFLKVKNRIAPFFVYRHVDLCKVSKGKPYRPQI